MIVKELLDKHNNVEFKGVKVDALLLPILQELNNKGYITEFSCQGNYNKPGEFYISFDKVYSFLNCPENIEINNIIFIGSKYGDDCYNEFPLILKSDGSIKTFTAYNGYGGGYMNSHTRIQLDIDIRN